MTANRELENEREWGDAAGDDLRPDEASDMSERTVPTGVRAPGIVWASFVSLLVIMGLLMVSGGLDTLARDLMRFFRAPAEVEGGLDAEAPEASAPTAGAFTFQELDIHPDVVFRPYTAGQLLSTGVSTPVGRMIREFRSLLDLYEQRQGQDDNFTIRVVDNRTDELLELFVLDAERQRYRSVDPGTAWDWGRVDAKRREATRRLVDKYASRGIPRPAITVKWGRKDQVLEAREREAEIIEYEIRLARYLGMSLLVTEIGTVETFNDDRLISPVGARSRYQMMPYVLRQNDVHHYRLSTAAGNTVEVFEEWHPLLTLEPAFVTAAGYRNAVGHEIPGISAYHTGPGNIYTVYRMFLTAGSDLFTPQSTVVDAYMWAVTSGYETVSKNSSFKTYSRGYVASAYGALRATEALPVDSARTLKAERVQIRSGERIFLSELLRTLESRGPSLDWGRDSQDLTIYERFRRLNEHFALPSGSGQGTGVTPSTDLRLTTESQGIPVRFFLPLGAGKILEDAGIDVLDERRTFRFAHDTYGTPDPSEVTLWDRQYQELVQDVANFGFTNANRARLNTLVDRFEELARARPDSHYRRVQLDIIKTHQRIWQSSVFDKLASAVSAARGSQRFEPAPPSSLPAPTFRVPN